ncbi:hypothetical protein ABB37_08204 [Leptomonas pyrrhocoris]|uniref:Uncharacterized protein n=1 Tax=Leptomonas pyrrhocoris TaxID=157538 RepID=A0A0N1J4F3_LEPPY|nr:hypothetical protein ABB37_08204 [Leptomonas pyrrhocoris]KPA76074.1 hypothetical protein ABB37_08204 [Leptomonas pyrrhocoris]|eukprot:XP_015654513.1 hypothetical protein ABB37_08204 [Leptomonas pyrrhocoris]
MDSKSRPSAFADASTQTAAVKEWRQRNAKHKETASSLLRKVKQLKSDSEAVQKTTLWLQERDALNREQEICEENLEVLRADLGKLVQDVEHEERQTELAALKSLILQQLKDLGALTRGTSLPCTARNEAAEKAERVTRLREWIKSERGNAQALARTLSSSSASGTSSFFAVDFDTATHEANEAFARLCHTYQPSEELRQIFASTLSSTEDEVRGRLESSQYADAATCEEDVLRTVCLIIKMGHQARQFNLSAATRAALADRVSAVFPSMTAAQVQHAVDEGLSLRRAQAAGKAALSDYHRSIASLLSSCESAFVVAKEAQDDRLEKEAAAQQRSTEQASRHARLAEKRAAHEAVLRRRRSVEEQRQSAAAAKADALRAKRAEEFQERLRLLQAYETQRALLREKEQQLREMKARAIEEEKAARMKRNEARVDFRRRQEEQRLKEQKEQEEEVQALQLKKQQALERFFASVDKQLGVEVDPQRVLKATSSSAQTESYETLAQTTRPSITGFSDDQIMKDPRVRLYHALLAAGLHTTPYGREVVTRGYHVAPSQMSSENNPLRGPFS